MGDGNDLSSTGSTGRSRASQRPDLAFFQPPKFRPPPPILLAEEQTPGEAEEPEAGNEAEAVAGNQTPPNRR